MDTYDLLNIKLDNFPREWNLRKLSPITIIFGKNGSGKSLLLRKIRDMNKETCHYSVPETAGNIAYSSN